LGEKLIFIGYPTMTKGSKLYDPKKVIIRRDVYFDESVPFLKTPVEKRAFEELIIPVYIRSRTTRSLEPPPASSSDSWGDNSTLLPPKR
jgi:hypothetical protein